MIILDTTSKTVVCFLGENHTTTQCDITGHWSDVTPSQTLVPGSTETVTNDTSAVTLVAAPAASTQRTIDMLTIVNRDTITHTFTLAVYDGTHTRWFATGSLSAGQSYTYPQSLAAASSGNLITTVDSNFAVTAGELQLATIASGDLIGNSGSSTAEPGATTLTALIDRAIGSTQGDVLYRNATGWVVLAPGTSGDFLQTQGASANPQWAAASGSGLITSVDTNFSVTGGGELEFASIAAWDVLGNASGSSAEPTAATLTALIDGAFGSSQGDILYRDSSVWKVLAPGTSGNFLKTQGASANPVWAATPSGYITSVDSNFTVTGGSELELATIASGDLIANSTSSTAEPTATTLTALIDRAIGSTQGDILYRGSSVWSVLAPGTNGQFLQTQGASANPQWAAASGGGGLYSQVMSATPTQTSTGLSSWLNQPSGATVTNAATGLTVYCPNQTSTFDLALLDISSLPSTPYSYSVLMGCTQGPTSNSFALLGWSDGTKYQGFFLGGQNGTSPYQKFVIGHLTTITSGSFTQDQANDFPTGLVPVWLKIRDDGTTVHFAWSSDGVNYEDMYSTTKSSGYLGSSGYSKVVFGACGLAGECYGTALSWTQGT